MRKAAGAATSQSSGIPNFTSFPDYAKLEPFPTTTEELVARFRPKPLDFAPGASWSYSNSGFVLLTYIVEKVSGTKYESFVLDNIFSPLGMKDSGDDSNSAVILNRASGYVAKNGQFENAGFVNMTVPAGAGGLYSTTEDLLKWEQGLFGGKLLRQASLDKMTTPFKEKESYAFGLQVDSVGGLKVIQHGGGIEGFNTSLAFYPDDKLTVVVLGNVNGNAPDEIANKLAAVSHGVRITLPGERKEITLDAKALSRVVGAYQLAPGINMLITLQDKQLISKLNTQQPVPMFPESPSMFFLKVVDAELEFSKDDAQGRPTLLILHQNGRDQSMPRLADSAFTRIAAAALTAEKRFKDQTPAPGGEAVLRRLIEEIRQGKPNYDLMSPNMAAVTRQQLTGLQASIVTLGAVQSVTFTRVTAGGADVYRVKHDNGAVEWTITIAPDGRLLSAAFGHVP